MTKFNQPPDSFLGKILTNNECFGWISNEIRHFSQIFRIFRKDSHPWDRVQCTPELPDAGPCTHTNSALYSNQWGQQTHCKTHYYIALHNCSVPKYIMVRKSQRVLNIYWVYISLPVLQALHPVIIQLLIWSFFTIKNCYHKK